MFPDVPSMFDRISPQYDRANRILSFGMDMRWRKKLSTHLPQKDGFTLLDLATGTGDQIRALFEMGAPITKATGIDLSKGMLEIAKKKFATKPYGFKTNFLKADALALPFEDKAFDVCTFSFGIRNVSDPIQALKEIRRVASCCLILEFSLPDNWFRRPYLFYLRHLLPQIGGFLSKAPDAYRYLNQTIEGFAYGDAFVRWMKESGWANARAIPLCFGSVTLYQGDLL